MPPDPTLFDELTRAVALEGVPAALAQLAERLTAARQYHELFDARLLEARVRLGLPVVLTARLDDLAEPQRTQMEEAYLSACREVGGLMLAEGRIREAWMYLRPVGEKAELAADLTRLAEQQDLAEQVIEVALYEGVCPRLGFELVLANYGTCNAITLFDAQMHGRPLADKQSVAGLLVRHLHKELLGNVRADIARREGSEPPEGPLTKLVAARPHLFENDNYHIDTTHLAAVVRFALWCDDRESLELALELTEYGRCLAAPYQFAGQAPFAETYPAHGHFFRALLGERVDEALAYFRQQADELADTESGPLAAEVVVALLARLNRHAEAFEESAQRLPLASRTAGFAPTLLELAARAGAYERLQQVCREQGDPLGFATGLVASQGKQPAAG